jgi:serine protease Do
MTRHIARRLAAGILAATLTLPLAASAKDTNPPARLKVETSAISRDARSGASYSAVIKKASPSVVTIYSKKTVRQQGGSRQYYNDPFFERFFGDGTPSGPSGRRGQRSYAMESLGSGVIVTDDGYILTNNHVVDGADTDGVEVALADGKQKLPAKVIGTDPRTDLAVLKIESKSLPAITLADSDKLEVGDVVLAIGNPFNVGQSVTMGIVSALGRGGLNITDYEDFIQTDAAINPGNSGGALVDTEGRLIGINQSIASPTRSNSGIGFAVPVNLAKTVIEQIISGGTVKRGFLGVMIQPLTPELAKAFNAPDTQGALISGVSANTPAAAAGFKEGDVILEVNGKKATDSQHARLLISQVMPGSEAKLKILRDGREKVLTAKLGELPGEEGQAMGDASGKIEHDSLDGVEVTDLDASNRHEYSVPENVRGALVSKVEEDSNAYKAGLRPGHVIQGIDRTPVTNADEAVKLSDKAKGDQVLLRVWSREGDTSGSRFITVDNTKKK